MTIAYMPDHAGVPFPTTSENVNGRSGLFVAPGAGIGAVIKQQHRFRKSRPSHRGDITEPAVDQLEHMWGAEIVRGVQRVAREHRAGVVLTEFGPERNTIRYWIDDTVARPATCVVTVAQLSEDQRDQLRARAIPFVVLDPIMELPHDVPFVGAT